MKSCDFEANYLIAYLQDVEAFDVAILVPGSRLATETWRSGHMAEPEEPVEIKQISECRIPTCPSSQTATGMLCTVIVFCEMVAALRCSFTAVCHWSKLQRRHILKMTPIYDSTGGSQLKGTADVGIVEPFLRESWRCGITHPCIKDVGQILGTTTSHQLSIETFAALPG